MAREKDLEIGLLLDFYGELLSDNKREAADLYYNRDLSLSEIAETMGITRQGVRDSLEKTKLQLLSYEEKLGLFEKFRSIHHSLSDIATRLQSLQEVAPESVQKEIDTVLAELQTITI